MTKHASKIRTSPPRILSVSEAAECLTISEQKIRYEIASGTLRVARIGRRIFVRLKDLDEYVEERLY